MFVTESLLHVHWTPDRSFALFLWAFVQICQEVSVSILPLLSPSDGMKMRNLKKDSPQNAVNEIDDDLKWVEDNIPAAIADS